MDESRQAALARRIIERRIPFNRLLGLRLERLEPERVALRFAMRPQFVGNYALGSLHGGVISAVLDTTGGLAALVGILKGLRGGAGELEDARFAKLGTIDLRVDYLRPGIGRRFVSSAVILRAGRRVSVTRMELHNETGTLIAVGTGTYIVS